VSLDPYPRLFAAHLLHSFASIPVAPTSLVLVATLHQYLFDVEGDDPVVRQLELHTVALVGS
jgi:hypothetical protein